MSTPNRQHASTQMTRSEYIRRAQLSLQNAGINTRKRAQFFNTIAKQVTGDDSPEVQKFQQNLKPEEIQAWIQAFNLISEYLKQGITPQDEEYSDVSDDDTTRDLHKLIEKQQKSPNKDFKTRVDEYVNKSPRNPQQQEDEPEEDEVEEEIEEEEEEEQFFEEEEEFFEEEEEEIIEPPVKQQPKLNITPITIPKSQKREEASPSYIVVESSASEKEIPQKPTVHVTPKPQVKQVQSKPKAIKVEPVKDETPSTPPQQPKSPRKVNDSPSFIHVDTIQQTNLESVSDAEDRQTSQSPPSTPPSHPKLLSHGNISPSFITLPSSDSNITEEEESVHEEPVQEPVEEEEEEEKVSKKEKKDKKHKKSKKDKKHKKSKKSKRHSKRKDSSSSSSSTDESYSESESSSSSEEKPKKKKTPKKHSKKYESSSSSEEEKKSKKHKHKKSKKESSSSDSEEAPKKVEKKKKEENIKPAEKVPSPSRSVGTNTPRSNKSPLKQTKDTPRPKPNKNTEQVKPQPKKEKPKPEIKQPQPLPFEELDDDFVIDQLIDI